MGGKMTEKAKLEGANQNAAVEPEPQVDPLTGLFDEMQALMVLMPGASLVTGVPVSTEEETEAMFDNMPV